MNERIKELLNKCNYTIDGTCDLSREEKFAELIILQCISITEETVGNTEGVTFGLGEDIKRYFGIEAVE